MLPGNSVVLRGIVPVRTGWLTTVMVGINTALASRWTVRILRLGTLVALVGLRRWRHLITFLGSVIVVELAAYQLAIFQARVRPFGVTIAGSWDGFSFPSPAVAALAVTLVGMAYALLPSGRPRSLGKWAAGAVLLLAGLARAYLAVDNPSDLVSAVILGVAAPVVAFRFFTPNEVFPVTYRRAKAAHLDVDGHRGDAIRTAVQEQLGLTVLDVEPVGLEGSAGSTPLRLRVAGAAGEPGRDLFAKLYAKSHVRADRSYKLGRTILYGALEDEAPFQSVRRFVEYEDYTLLRLQNVGVPAPAPFGIVPSATFIPCILPLPGGWSYGGSQVRSGLAHFWVNSDQAGARAVEVRLTRTCDVAGAALLRLRSPPAGLRGYQEPTARQPRSSVRYFVFAGGCVTERFSFTRQTARALFGQADQFLGFTPRSVYVQDIREHEGLTLCGAEAPPCPGQPAGDRP